MTRTISFQHFIAAAICSGVVAAATSTAKLSAEDGRAEIASAFKRTKTAQTIEDFSEILDLCGTAASRAQPERLAAYTRQLQAWTHNRRGEVYTAKAAAANLADDKVASAELDVLALADFEDAIRLDESQWKPWLNRGVSYGVLGRHAEAVSDFTRVIELKPEEADGWYNRAEVLVELGRFEEAIADYHEVLLLATDDISALIGRSIAHFRSGNSAAALQDMDAAIQMDDTGPTVFIQRADMLQSLGRWEEAAADLRRAITVGPDSALTYRATAWLMATCPEARYRDEQLALQAAHRAVNLVGRESWQLLDTLAAAHANAGQYDEAVQAVAQALGLAPPQHKDEVRARASRYSAQQPYRSPVVQVANTPNPNVQR